MSIDRYFNNTKNIYTENYTEKYTDSSINCNQIQLFKRKNVTRGIRYDTQISDCIRNIFIVLFVTRGMNELFGKIHAN